MSSSQTPAYPPALDVAELDRLLDVVEDWTIAHGLAVRPPPTILGSQSELRHVLATSAPITLFPSLYPRQCFEEARKAQQPYNELYARVSQDETYLAEVVKEVADDFVDRLWAVHLRVVKDGYTQPLSLGLFRSDYILHQADTALPELKQVEFNTIASSFGGLSARTSALHKFLATTEYRQLPSLAQGIGFDLPDNNSAAGLAAGLRAAHDAYGSSVLGFERCIVFLVQGGERNVFDQRHLEYALRDQSPAGVPVFRLPFSQVLERTKLASSPKRQLLYSTTSNPQKWYEVTVVYLRAGYGPGDYPDDASWDARYQLERSAAIKCPTILTQIAGTKKVQQQLATPPSSNSPPGLAKFIAQDSPEFQRLWRTFTNIYPMDTSEAGLQARKLATDPEQCKRFVLKPQREGGGNNTYRTAIPPLLRSMPESHWGQYILMELITPPPLTNMILRYGKVEQGGVISELGIYGSCIWSQASGKVLRNEESGYLLRTKGDQSEEGGVAAGFGSMDSCNLV